MEVNLNENTRVEVEAKMTIFRLKSKEKLSRVLYVRNDKIFGCELTFMNYFNYATLFRAFIIGVIAALGYFLYDTQYLGYIPNWTINVSIVVITLLIGFIVSFKRSRHLVIVVEADDFSIMTKSRFSFPVGKDITDKKLEDLMYLLVS